MSATMAPLWVALGEHSEFEYLLLETFTGKDFETWKLDYFYASLAEGTEEKQKKYWAGGSYFPPVQNKALLNRKDQ